MTCICIGHFPLDAQVIINLKIFLFLISLFLTIFSFTLYLKLVTLNQKLMLFEEQYISKTKHINMNILSLEYRCFAMSLNIAPENFPTEILNFNMFKIPEPRRIFLNEQSIRTSARSH